MKTVIKIFPVDLRVRVGYGTAFFLLLISYLLTLYGNAELLKQARLVDRSNKVIIQLEGLLSSLKDAESGMRGYLLMNDSAFLPPYESSREIADSTFELLRTESVDDAARLSQLASLKTLIDKKFQLLGSFIHDFALDSGEVTLASKQKLLFELAIMRRIRQAVKEMQETAQGKLKERLQEMTGRYNILNVIIIISLALAIVFAVYGYFTYARENRARRIADEKVGNYQQQLKDQILQLDKANKKLIQMRSIEKFAATGRIARTIAHEVRNPLTNINLAVDQLKVDLDGDLPEQHGIMLEMIARNSVRINQLITDLLNSTKFTELVYKKISINQLLDETLELAKDRIRLNRINVVKDYSDDICDIAVDVERIKIAVLNLIVNAIEAMEPGKGTLQLITLGKEDKCVVRIVDNGPGIDPENVSKLFEPYFTTKAKGTGLGLTNTQNIILNHNGHISIESEKGKGTTFSISLDFA